MWRFSLLLSRINTVCLLLLLLPGVLVAGAFGQNSNSPAGQKPLDIVFSLDLSGSTNGLLDDFRDQLWMMVNQVQQMDPKPSLRMGVVGFSRPSFGKENAYVKVLVPLTNQLDYLAAEMYKLRPSIEKGDQIVSAALRASVNDMKWSDASDAIKLVFLVGNGMVSDNKGHEYVKWCEQARQKGIVIHTLYVMRSANFFKELPGWRRIATLTGGMQTEITVNKPETMKVFVSVTKDLAALNQRINATYVWVGRDSSVCRRALSAADSGAFYANDKDVFLNRLYYKSSPEYAQQFAGCDIAAGVAVVSGDASAEAGSGGAYIERLKEIYRGREVLRAQLRKEFDVNDLLAVQQAFIAGEVEDEGILSRSVLNLLFRSWGMR